MQDAGQRAANWKTLCDGSLMAPVAPGTSVPFAGRHGSGKRHLPANQEALPHHLHHANEVLECRHVDVVAVPEHVHFGDRPSVKCQGSLNLFKEQGGDARLQTS